PIRLCPLRLNVELFQWKLLEIRGWLVLLLNLNYILLALLAPLLNPQLKLLFLLLAHPIVLVKKRALSFYSLNLVFSVQRLIFSLQLPIFYFPILFYPLHVPP